MNHRKKMLFLSTFPYPLTAGGFQAFYNGMSSIKNDVEIHLIYIDPIHRSCKRKREELNELLENKVVLVPYRYNPVKTFFRACFFIRNFLASFLKIKKKNPSFFFDTILDKYSPVYQEYIDFINDYIKKEKIEIVQIEFLEHLHHILTLPSNVKKVFVHHEIGFVVNELRLQSVGRTEYRTAMTEMSNMLEIGLLNKCDAIITLSEIDKKKLIQAGVKVPIYSSFAIVNTYMETLSVNKFYNTLSFIGPSFHAPNYIGIKWFLENCWENLLSQDPSYHLKIIGNWSEDKRVELSKKYKNVEFLGFVPNLADALNNTIMIVPITVGSGIRMKILEAASLGIPFVSTSIGAEGLPFENGVDCLLGDTPDSFIESILKLRDKSLREKFAGNANKLVKEKYSIEALRKNRLSIYERVLNEGRV